MVLMMTVPNVPGLFAAQNNVVTVIVIIVFIVGWLYNVISGKNPARPPAIKRPRQPPPRPRNDRLQDEIDIFIKDVSPGRAKSSPTRPTAPASKAPSRGEANAGRNKPRKPAKPLVSQDTPVQHQRPTPGADIANRSMPGTRDLGNAIRDEVAGQLPAHKIEREVAADLKDRIKPAVADHLGQFVASTSPPATVGISSPAPQAAQIAELLHRPASIRQAILINTILSPPLSLAAARGRQAK